MKKKSRRQSQLRLDSNPSLLDYEPIEPIKLNKSNFIQRLNEIESSSDLNSLKQNVEELRFDLLNKLKKDKNGIFDNASDDNVITFRGDILQSEFRQILESQTMERAQYYIKRLRKNGTFRHKSKINEIDFSKWKEYDEKSDKFIRTDSLWLLDNRDTSGAHLAWYWGNFVPEIPRQMMLRYTKSRDWVLDAFLGSGTTLIECRRLGRNGIGIELNPNVAKKAEELIQQEENASNAITDVKVDDSGSTNIKAILERHKIECVQLLIMHPPYHDIIHFSEDPRDLSNAQTIQDFLKMFGAIVENITPFLEKGRYLALVIGDKYTKSEWIPLGFCCMKEVLKRGFLLKSIIVKNFEETRGKRNQKELWRYRALVGGFYVFKHEYIMLFEKK